jgi:hypothetical protein
MFESIRPATDFRAFPESTQRSIVVTKGHKNRKAQVNFFEPQRGGGRGWESQITQLNNKGTK